MWFNSKVHVKSYQPQFMQYISFYTYIVKLHTIGCCMAVVSSCCRMWCLVTKRTQPVGWELVFYWCYTNVYIAQ